jgi:hypothetical protein
MLLLAQTSNVARGGGGGGGGGDPHAPTSWQNIGHPLEYL